MYRRTRVVVDATTIPANHGGVARYIYGMLQGFTEESVDLIVACQPDSADTIHAIVPWAKLHTASRVLRFRPLRMLWEQLALPVVVRRHRADVLHSPTTATRSSGASAAS